MGFFDFLIQPMLEAILPIVLLVKVGLTIAFIVLAIVIIRWLPKGKIVGLILCLLAIVATWMLI